MNPLHLLRKGYDTVEIASLLNTTEAEVEKAIHQLRRKERTAEHQRVYQAAYNPAYRAENAEAIAANAKRRDARKAAELREIRSQFA